MSQITPIVFVVDDDVSVRESLELLVRFEGWQPETFASHKNSSTTHEFIFRTASYLTSLFRVLTGWICKESSPTNGRTCRSSSSRAMAMCP